MIGAVSVKLERVRRAVTKAKAGYWTPRCAFAQVRCSSNIQLLPYPLETSAPTVGRDLGKRAAAQRFRWFADTEEDGGSTPPAPTT
jgi:hypothetical protein